LGDLFVGNRSPKTSWFAMLFTGDFRGPRSGTRNARKTCGSWSYKNCDPTTEEIKQEKHRKLVCNHQDLGKV
jgi:hypothetical protein